MKFLNNRLSNSHIARNIGATNEIRVPGEENWTALVSSPERAVQIEQALNAVQWTTELPQHEGWYWRSEMGPSYVAPERRSEDVRVVYVRNVCGEDIGNGDGDDQLCVDTMPILFGHTEPPTTKWAGPIFPPRPV